MTHSRRSHEPNMAEIIVALDLPSAADALDMVDRLGDSVDFYKVGAPLFTSTGPALVRELRGRGKRVFLDLKYHDIPNTVAAAVAHAAELDVELLTVHASGGESMIRAARQAADGSSLSLLAVTVLTSFSAAELESVWGKELRSLREEVERLATLAHDSGAHGVVSSALEAESIKRKFGSSFLVVTPGIRPSGAAGGDQVRTATPAAAARAGADYLVIGRPIVDALDPAAAAAAMLQEIVTLAGSAP
jgi:orotidine-5'-phosphate decarboxylase